MNDDVQLGHVLTRREALGLLAAPGVLMLTGWPVPMAGAQGLPGCVVRPQQTEGPYFVDESLNRSDIRSDPSDGSTKPGAQLDLVFKVSRISANTCAPFPGAVVDVWHCDHLGVYSDVDDPGSKTVGKKFLRGYQVSGSDGVARFTTIYPGHVHFKIRSAPSSTPGFEFTSQLYFDDTLTDQVQARQPYATKGQRRQRNTRDGIFRRGGTELMLDVAQKGQGYAATFPIALQNV